MKRCIAAFIILFAFLEPRPCLAAFPDHGWGARLLGMGGTGATVSGDLGTAFYNPAGIAGITERQAAFMYSKPYLNLGNVELSSFYLGVAYPFAGRGTVAVNITDFDGAGIYRENMAILTCARRFPVTKDLSVACGLSAKYLTHMYDWNAQRSFSDQAAADQDPVVAAGSRADAVTADAGILVFAGNRFAFGLSAGNITAPDIGLFYEDTVPLDLRAGLGYEIGPIRSLESVWMGIDLSGRGRDLDDALRRITTHVGAEGWFDAHTYGLRVGANDDEITAGGSFCQTLGKSFSLQIDYAFLWSLSINDNLGTHKINATLKF